MIGSLGLFRQLSALGRAAPAGSAADINKRAARLPEDAKLRFKAIRAEQKAKIDAARAAAQAEFDKFLEDYGMPPRADYRKERKVVAAFVFGMSERAAGLSTDGMVLRVGDRAIARRDDPTSRTVLVCPGKFGNDKTARRAANAALDILGAGVRVDDRGEEAFLRSARGGGRGVISRDICYKVDVSQKIRARAADALMSGELIGQSSLLPVKRGKGRKAREERAGFVAPKSGAALEARKAELRAKYGAALEARKSAKSEADLEQPFEASIRTSRDFDGLGRMPRRRRTGRRTGSRKSRR
jgi:hypothetical protein